MAERSKARVWSRSLAVIAGSNPAKNTDVSVVSVLCCQVDVSVTGHRDRQGLDSRTVQPATSRYID